LTVGALNRATASRTDLSGKGVNVSVALRQFGLESVAVGFVAGLYGRVLLEGLRDWGLTCDFIEVSGETRSNITVIDSVAGVTTKLNEPGPEVTDDDIAALHARLRERVAADDVCVFSGSLPPGAPVDTYARLIDTVHERGGTAVLDTSGPAFRAGCAAAPDWIKPNHIEAAELTGLPLNGENDLVAGLRAILAQKPRRILLSMGERGAAFADESCVWLASPPAIREISAVGAGDSAMSAALWAWLRGLPADDILRWATASGTAAAMLDGTVMPSLTQVRSVYEQVALKRLA
jgi:1-phosphofructokinase family hexose kinase